MKIYKLVETFKSDPDNYKSTWRSLLGYMPNGKMDRSKREIDIYNVSLQELAFEFLGRDYMTELTKLWEGPGGGVVLPSTFKQISGFSDSVSGLISSMVMDAYQSPAFIGSQLVTEKQSNVQGGRLIGASNDGEVPYPQSLQVGEPAPAVGLRETYVSIPNFTRRANSIEINRNTFKYDLTGSIQERAVASGFNIARSKEIEIADLCMGISTTYSRDNPNKAATNVTYQAAAVAAPYNYVNESNNELLDWNAIDDATVILGQNLDPSTGYEIDIAVDNMVLVVAPGRRARTHTITQAVQIRTDSAVDQNATRLSSSPIPSFPVLSSQIWYNRLILAAASGGEGLTADQATERWYMIHPSKAFQYHTAWPFATVQTPIGHEQTRRDIVMSLVTSEEGTGVVVEPRYAYQANDQP